MGAKTMTVTVSTRWWWVPAYLNTLRFLCYVFGTEPDTDRVAKFLAAAGGFKVKVA